MIALIFTLALIASLPLHAAGVNLPEGFSLRLFAHVPGARSLVAVPELGAVFVGTRDSALYVIIDKDRDGQADNVKRLSNNLKAPNGLAWKNGFLYIAEQHQLVRFALGERIPDKLPTPEILYTDFPDKRWHGWRYATFGPDGGLYVSIGVPCNICQPKGIEGTILRFEPETWVPVVFARGIRNSVGLAFNPITRDMFFTDNGADNMGDDVPPDELNRAPVGGLHFGYPYFGGGQVRTTEFMERTLPANRPPVHNFQPHVTPLGLEFYQGTRFPQHYQNGIFVAQHGSWNRSSPVGYQLSFHPFDAHGNLGPEEAFLTGWLSPEDHGVTGRPVDLEEWADGRLLISDDYEGAVYILDYQ